MKAILEFNLPEDDQEHELAVNAGKYYSVLWDLDQYLRNFVKYPSEKADPVFTDTMAQVRDKLWKLMSSYNLDFDK